MKEKRMNCERARTICIVGTMAKLGHFPVRKTEKEAWFLSPFRSETQASFKVSRTLNRWYDHGEGIGGNLVDLICRLHSWSIREVLEFLQNQTFDFSFQQQPSIAIPQQKKIAIKNVKPINHIALTNYLESRKIQVNKVHQYIKEIHFELNQKRFFAIGFQNDKGGWELRNRFQKLCCSPKAITHIKFDHDSLTVFEGFFDFLSAITLHPDWITENDYLVLNSLAFVRETPKILAFYETVNLALDNDSAGDNATREFQKMFQNIIDRRGNYSGYKDLNEKLISWSYQ